MHDQGLDAPTITIALGELTRYRQVAAVRKPVTEDEVTMGLAKFQAVACQLKERLTSTAAPQAVPGLTMSDFVAPLFGAAVIVADVGVAVGSKEPLPVALASMEAGWTQMIDGVGKLLAHMR